MRIAFDLDETLVPVEPHLQKERPWGPLRLLFPEALRPGSRRLLRQLHQDGHELWIYTSSYRKRVYIRTWFRCLGVPLAGVVNQERHERIVRPLRLPAHSASKYPPAFGIELLIDDSLGVAEEGRRHGFDVLRIDPLDPDWVDKVRTRISGPG